MKLKLPHFDETDACVSIEHDAPDLLPLLRVLSELPSILRAKLSLPKGSSSTLTCT